jgi:hypothetical protein
MTGYYVSIIREPGPRQKVCLFMGPYPTKQEAEGWVQTARGFAESVDPRTVWDHFGVTKVEADNLPVGRWQNMPQAA